MEFGCFDTEDEQEEQIKYTIGEVWFMFYGGAGCYDDPWKAMEYGDVISPLNFGGDFWEQWKKDHYVGRKNVEERALKDPLVRKWLIRFGLLPDQKGKTENGCKDN